MFSSRFSSQASRLFEHLVLRTDVARAWRSSIAMALAWVACLLTGHAAAAALVATAAQNVAITQPGFATIVAEIGESIQSLAARLEARQLVTTIPRPNVEMPMDASAEESLVYSQLTKIVAEIEAMAIEAGIPVGQVA